VSTNRYSRPIGRPSQCAANGTRSTWTTILFLGEQQDIIDPEAAILVAGQMTETPRFCPPASGRRLLGSPTRSPVGQPPNPGSTAVPSTFGFDHPAQPHDSAPPPMADPTGRARGRLLHRSRRRDKGTEYAQADRRWPRRGRGGSCWRPAEVRISRSVSPGCGSGRQSRRLAAAVEARRKANTSSGSHTPSGSAGDHTSR
jgi:hypothetical protein